MKPSTHPSRAVRIGILAYPGCMGTQVFGIAEVLRIGNDLAAAMNVDRNAHFDTHIIGVGARTVKMAGGVCVSVERPLGPFDLLIVPGLEINRQVDWSAKLAPLKRELTFVRQVFARGTPIASVCVGAFLLGEAGILDARQVTTAWLFAPDLAQRYPAARVQPDAVLREDGGVTTTGAVSSAFDLALQLIKRTLGAEVASATARVTLLPEQRASQTPFVDARWLEARLPAFSHQLVQWFAPRLSDHFELNRIADAFCVSPSTLMRRVKKETGHTPLRLLQLARVEQAKQLLRSTDASLAHITEAVGYVDVTSFSRLFTRLIGETPACYRRRGAA